MGLEILMNVPGVEIILSRLSNAILTTPSVQAWSWVALYLGIYTLVAVPVGLKGGFIKVEPSPSWVIITGVIFGAFLRPALTEEVFFRVLLLPYPSETTSYTGLWLWGSFSLALFILYHPLNALTFFPAGRQTFFNPIFLLLAAFLGVICTLAYWQSGSLWPPIVIHWIVVVIWLLYLGGYQKLY